MSKTVLKINQSTTCHQLAHYGELKDEKESNSELSLVLFAFSPKFPAEVLLFSYPKITES